MTKMKILMCGFAAASLMTAGAAGAQTPMSSGGAMKSGAMASDMKMSKADMAMMKKCKAMSHDKMMMDAKCKAMMEAHPDMMSGDKMMSDGKMMKK